jgi:hypothetical protein
VVIIAAALALARQAWQNRRWRRNQALDFSSKGSSDARSWRRSEEVVPFKTEASVVTDPAEQLRLVIGATFEKCRILNRSEAQVFYAAGNQHCQYCGPQAACDGSSQLG